MSARAGLDSIAMKTLALVTAIFLPATFIATLFSMSMFDWQGGNVSVVSSNFWVFWVVSVPLSIVILGLWWYIWNLSRRHYGTLFRQDFEHGEPPSELRGLWETFKRGTVREGGSQDDHVGSMA